MDAQYRWREHSVKAGALRTVHVKRTQLFHFPRKESSAALEETQSAAGFTPKTAASSLVLDGEFAAVGEKWNLKTVPLGSQRGRDCMGTAGGGPAKEKGRRTPLRGAWLFALGLGNPGTG